MPLLLGLTRLGYTVKAEPPTIKSIKAAPMDTNKSLNKLTQGLFETLKYQDDRGAVLSAASFAEELLGDLLAAFMLEGKASKDLLHGFSAPLGTFSTRIKMAYSLGLIDDTSRSALDRIRKLRNSFAHTWEAVSIEKSQVAFMLEKFGDNSLGGLPWIKLQSSDTPRETFDKCSVLLMFDLTLHSIQLEKQKPRSKMIHGKPHSTKEAALQERMFVETNGRLPDSE